MNSIKKHLALGLFYAAAILYAGCLPEEDLKWSDDGSVGLLSVEEGLYVVDGETGELKQIAEDLSCPWPDISGDGKTIVYCQVKMVADLDEGLALLDAAEVKMIEDYAGRAATAVVGKGGIEGMAAAEKKVQSSEHFGRWVGRYMCEKGPEDALLILGQEWTQNAKEAQLPYYEILITNADGEETQVVTRRVFETADLRLSPGGKNVAYLVADPETGGDEETETYYLFVASVQGAVKKMLVGERLAILGHDWRPDGQVVAYISADGPTYTESPVFGTLRERIVADSAGALLSTESGAEGRLGGVGCSMPAKNMVSTFFFAFARVQYGPGGRIFFPGADLRLPMLLDDDHDPQWSVYCYDTTTGAAVNVLPAKVISETSGFDNLSPTVFSLSPDGRKLLLVMEGNRFATYEPGAGLTSLKVPMKADEGFEDGLEFMPAWKGSAEVSFIVSDKSHFDIGGAAKAIGTLDDRGDFSVLSKSWPQFELLK